MRNRAAPIVAIILQFPSMLLADGGTLRLSRRSGDFQVSVFTSPAVLRCGAIDVSVLVQDAATGKVRIDVPVMIRLTRTAEEGGDAPTDVLEQAASTSAAANKLFRAATFQVQQPGNWRGSVSVGAASTDASGNETEVQPLAFEMVVSPPPPAWLELAPWIGWPFAAVALFLIHQRLASGAGQ
jgi:hypothetical protein